VIVDDEVWLIKIVRVEQFWLNERNKSACPASGSFQLAGSKVFGYGLSRLEKVNQVLVSKGVGYEISRMI
jgi:hypothetical protein